MRIARGDSSFGVSCLTKAESAFVECVAVIHFRCHVSAIWIFRSSRVSCLVDLFLLYIACDRGTGLRARASDDGGDRFGRVICTQTGWKCLFPSSEVCSCPKANWRSKAAKIRSSLSKPTILPFSARLRTVRLTRARSAVLWIVRRAFSCCCLRCFLMHIPNVLRLTSTGPCATR